MKYRSDIDGLRAIAVVSVIIYHMGFPLFNAGFLGVDVFFVISGFLITKIMMDGKKYGKFSIVQFYDKRARRLLPALFFVIAMSIALSWLLMVPSQIKDFGQSIIAALAFSSNIYFWLKLDYWGQSAEFIPLLHIWSLAVEEQFYLIFPFVVILAKSDARLRSLILVITIVSFVSMVVMQSKGYTSEVFYLPFFRAWELALGCLAATMIDNTKPKYATTYSTIGIIMLLSSILFFDINTTYALLYAVPVIGTFLVILYNQPGSLVYRMLSLRALVVTGLASYSLYLVHQPVLAFFRIYKIESLSIADNIICLVLIILLSIFSYHCIEKPFRSKRFTLNPKYYIGLLVVTFVFISFGFTAHKTNGFSAYKLANMPPEKARMISLVSQEKAGRPSLPAKYNLTPMEEFVDDGRKRILFVGDSISGDLYTATAISPLGETAQIRNFGLQEECYGTDPTLPTCDDEISTFVNSSLLADADIIVVANSFLPVNAGSFSNFLTFDNVKDKKVIVYKQHQFMDINSVVLLGDKFDFDYSSKKLSSFIYSNRHERTMESNKIIQQIATENNVSTINGFEFFCNDALKECELFNSEGVPFIFDIVHVTPTGFAEFSQWFYKELVPLI